MSGSVKRRAYDNSRRRAGARGTRQAIVTGARELFIDLGYPNTTFAAIAERAGVSVQTVYGYFPAKRDLVHDVVDQAIAGDDLPVPIADRPEVAAMRAEPDPAQKIRLHASFVATIMQRAAPVDQMLRGAAAVDPEVAELWTSGAWARQAGMVAFATHLAEGGHLRDDLSIEEAAERMAVLIDPEVYRMTVGLRGWSTRQYEDWLAELLIASLLRSPAASR
ncbi:MAG TPA: helix-turn-helix domain-containing protein [Acidimicrobiales bacterium]|nr:helix-turn-helix domain-containing protein [Acidimicrobiales bacterium]